jgi:hypothetical protein
MLLERSLILLQTKKSEQFVKGGESDPSVSTFNMVFDRIREHCEEGLQVVSSWSISLLLAREKYSIDPPISISFLDRSFLHALETLAVGLELLSSGVTTA